MSDYISREAAIEYFRKEAEESRKAFEELGGESGIYADAYNELADYFENFPAADVEPVRHGWWKPLLESEITGWNPEFAGRDPIGSYVCSCCNHEATYTCDDAYDLSNYCPNCGAKMQGGENHDD